MKMKTKTRTTSKQHLTWLFSGIILDSWLMMAEYRGAWRTGSGRVSPCRDFVVGILEWCIGYRKVEGGA